MSINPYPIEFCGNCRTGQHTKDLNSASCDQYAPGEQRRCAGWQPGHFIRTERVVYICSPLKGDKIGPLEEIIKKNLRKATAYCRAAVASHAIPICPHLYFSPFLDDRHPSERNLGREMALELLKKCDEVWVFGKPSEGMRAEIELAERLHLPIVTIPQATIEKIEQEDEINGRH